MSALLTRLHQVLSCVTLVGTVSLCSPKGIAAQAGDLQLLPASPTRGQTISVLYRPIPALRAYQKLKLRARFRSASTLPSAMNARTGIATELVMDASGVFRGRVELPDTVVYAALAVEDPSGEFVDHNDFRLWEIIVSDGNGKPLYEALEQRHSDLVYGSWEEAFRTAKRAAELYPDRVRAWYLVHFYEQQVLRASEAQAARLHHQEKLRAFDTHLRLRRVLDADDIGIMGQYAQALGDTALARYWNARLLAEAPRSFWAVQERSISAAANIESSPAKAATDMEGIWAEVGALHPAVISIGLSAAERTSDPVLIERWIDRALGQAIGPAWMLALPLTQHPPTRQEGISRLTRSIELLVQRW